MKKVFLFFLMTIVCQMITAGLFAQNVGIGTTTPSENLHVVGNKALFQTNFVGIGVGNPVTPYTVFQVKRNFNDFVGMYVDAGSAGQPFYGYSMGGVSKAYSCFDGANNQFEYHQSVSGLPDFLIQGNTRVVFNTDFLGIGTYNPLARLHVADNSVLFSATGSTPITQVSPPISGAGRRTMWYADKAAFRVGFVDGTQWDKDNIGDYSFASGYNTIASDITSTAMGNRSVASGYASIAIGELTNAVGDYSTAIGNGSESLGIGSVALGSYTNASGDNSTAMGNNTIASGHYSTAIGDITTASGNYSTAIGNYVSTNNKEGCVVIGDHSSAGVVMNSASTNSMRARFSSGYRFYTTSDLTANALLAGGDNSWSTSSDVRLKENFEDIDGESILNKIAAFHLTSWNYKTQDPAIFRHYGPMAQDFHAAFGHDGYGTIGNDTTINQSDFLGINFMAVQALEKRTESLRSENSELKNKIHDLQQEISDVRGISQKNDDQDLMIKRIRTENEMLTKRLEKLETLFESKDKGPKTKEDTE